MTVRIITDTELNYRITHDYFDYGLSVLTISKKYKISKSTVRRRIEKHKELIKEQQRIKN